MWGVTQVLELLLTFEAFGFLLLSGCFFPSRDMKFYTDIYGSQRDQQVSEFYGPSLYAGGVGEEV